MSQLDGKCTFAAQVMGVAGFGVCLFRAVIYVGCMLHFLLKVGFNKLSFPIRATVYLSLASAIVISVWMAAILSQGMTAFNPQKEHGSVPMQVTAEMAKIIPLLPVALVIFVWIQACSGKNVTSSSRKRLARLGRCLIAGTILAFVFAVGLTVHDVPELVVTFGNAVILACFLIAAGIGTSRLVRKMAIAGDANGRAYSISWVGQRLGFRLYFVLIGNFMVMAALNRPVSGSNLYLLGVGIEAWFLLSIIEGVFIYAQHATKFKSFFWKSELIPQKSLPPAINASMTSLSQRAAKSSGPDKDGSTRSRFSSNQQLQNSPRALNYLAKNKVAIAGG
ncbi:unnamed protein product [Chrysoparadoxa australica]